VICSHLSHGSLAIWLAVALFATTPTAALAQQDSESGPIRLVAPNEKSAPATTNAPPPGQAAPRPSNPAVAVVALDRPDPSSVGVLTADDGGFDVSLWAGSRRSLIEMLLPRIPPVTPSRALQSLRKRLLLTTAQVPAGDPVAPTFLGLRAERLAATGDYPSALELVALASPQMDDPALDVVRVEGALLSGNHQTACEVVERALAAGRRSPYWVRRLSFCRVLDGDAERAVLTAAILRELPGEPDPLFDLLLAALAESSTLPIVATTDLTPLHFAMIRAARRAIPDSAAANADPAMLRAIATSANASIEARLRAGEAAEIAGVLAAESLGQIYASLAFSEAQRANVLSAALDMPRATANALLFQAAVGEVIPAAQAEALRTALRLSNPRTHGMIARVNADRLAAISPDPDLMWFASDAGLALLHAGGTTGARAWFDVARQVVSDVEPNAALAILKLWAPLMMSVSDDPLPTVPSALSDWWSGVVSLDPAQAQNIGSMVLTTFEAVGLDVPDDAWDSFTGVAVPVLVERPSVGALRSLETAAMAGRIGETVLLSLVILGEAHPAEFDSDTVSRVIAALMAVGLVEDARALALEAIVGRSL
jgi:hypothetical protein